MPTKNWQHELTHGWCKGFFSIFLLVSSCTPGKKKKTTNKIIPWIVGKWAELTGGKLRLQHAHWHSKTKTSRRRCYLLRPGWPRRDTHSQRKREGLCELEGWIHKRGGHVQWHESTSNGGGHQANMGCQLSHSNQSTWTCTRAYVFFFFFAWERSCLGASSESNHAHVLCNDSGGDFTIYIHA